MASQNLFGLRQDTSVHSLQELYTFWIFLFITFQNFLKRSCAVSPYSRLTPSGVVCTGCLHKGNILVASPLGISLKYNRLTVCTVTSTYILCSVF